MLLPFLKFIELFIFHLNNVLAIRIVGALEQHQPGSSRNDLLCDFNSSFSLFQKVVKKILWILLYLSS